eukprot:s1014_g5.t1
MATMVSPDQLVWRRPPAHLLDPLMVEHMPQHPPAVGDEALQHWINRVRWHSDRAVLAGRAAAKAEALAEEVAKKVIQMAGGVLPDQLNLAAHRAQLTEGDGAKDLSTPGSQSGQLHKHERRNGSTSCQQGRGHGATCAADSGRGAA